MIGEASAFEVGDRVTFDTEVDRRSGKLRAVPAGGRKAAFAAEEPLQLQSGLTSGRGVRIYRPHCSISSRHLPAVDSLVLPDPAALRKPSVHAR